MLKPKTDKDNNSTKIEFNKVSEKIALDPLKSEWRKSLTAPQDDMWEAFTDSAEHWEINFQTNRIGYACVNTENRLLQFYLVPEWMQEGNIIFKQFIDREKIKEAMIGTNNPHFFSLAVHFQKSIEIRFYLFSDFLQEKVSEKNGKLRPGKTEDLEDLAKFCNISTGAPTDWLKGYISNLINKQEYFVFEHDGKILGICEVRKSESNPKVANLGMIVSPDHRKNGLGTFLLGKAKEIALERKLQPICGCDKNNIGSLKSIHKNGFRNVNQMLLFKFDSE